MRVAARMTAACIAALALLVAPSAALAAALFGFNDDWTPETVQRTVAISASFHANSARAVVYWNSVEPQPGVYDWYGLDVAYQTMLQRGIRPLYTIVSAPPWAIQRGCHPIYKCQQTPAHDHDYRVFLSAFTKRYPRAVGIEVGQEPNLTNWSVHPDPRRYAQILKSAWTAIRNANPHMPVILGSTCCTYANGHGNIGAAIFLANLYRYGIKGHYTAIGFHIYPGRAVSLVASDLLSELANMRAVRNANGDHSPFWVTETGFPSRGVSHYGGGVFNERNQAQREAIAYTTLNRVRDVYAIYIYRLLDALHPSSYELGMGIYYRNYRPKQAALTLKRLTAHR